MTRCRGLVALLALGTLTFPAAAQEAKKIPTIPFDGVEVFRYLLKENGFEPIESVRGLAESAADETVLIVLGTTGGLAQVSEVVGNLHKYREAGGSVLIASDYEEVAQLAPLGVAIVGLPVRQAAVHAYRKTPSCPRLTDFGLANPALFVPVRSLATNRPSFLVLKEPTDLEPLAVFPPDCGIAFRILDERVSLKLPSSPAGGPAAYIAGSPAGHGPRGRALVIAGHGLFTNGMLLQRDNDNFLFATNCLKWLGEAPDGRRRHALLLVDGRVVTDFDAALKPPLPPIPMPTTRVVNQLLRGLQRERFFQRLIDDNLDLEAVGRYLLLGVTFVLLAYGARRLVAARHQTENAAPLLVGPFAQPPGAGPWVEQRHRAQAAGN
jgi:hypothetical protein